MTIEMIGRKFGKLTVVGFWGKNSSGSRMWNCVCDCGEKRVVDGSGLRAGRNKSCGCASPRFTSERVTTPGLTKTRTYNIWSGMHHRCSSKAKGKSKRLYYDKGIRVCDRWSTLENFIEDMGYAPDGLSIDRIDGTKGYSKENCRWATAKQQANNQLNNVLLDYNGRRQTVAQWAEETGLKANTITCRLRRGWGVALALNTSGETLRSTSVKNRERACVVCGKKFIPRPSQLRANTGKFCSQKCNGKSKLNVKNN